MKQIINAIIRPAARHILTIGKGLIKDQYTALVELVKNAYDANATEVTIKLSNFVEQQNEKLKITIQDNGHGMTTETVLTKWLVPSTDNKEKNNISKGGQRRVQGKKGIGRYASSILGHSILMQTIDEDTKEKTEIYIEWKEFENPKYTYLDEVPILVESTQNDKNAHGTFLEIITNKLWSKIEIEELSNELKRLILPNIAEQNDDIFNVKLITPNNQKITIEPYPVLDYYHYRIQGSINMNNEKNLVEINAVYENNYLVENKTTENITQLFKLKNGIFCGMIEFDIRAVDLDKADKENLNQRNKDLNVVELWASSSGMSIFRGDFRIRPYGDNDIDWLKLDARRVNNPTYNLSNNQLLGIIKIQDENISQLEEKATREGLKENEAFEGLKECIIQALAIIERERSPFKKARKQASKPSIDITKKLPEVADLTELGDKIGNALEQDGVSEATRNKIKRELEKTQKEKEKQTQAIQKNLIDEQEQQEQVVAIFQNQATLGKVIIQIFHETTNHLHAVRGKLPLLTQWNRNIQARATELLRISDEYINTNTSKIVNNLQLIESSVEAINKYYNKLKPLTVTKRRPKKTIYLKAAIENAIHIFDILAEKSKISLNLQCPSNLKITLWEDDLAAILINIIDNSIYWLNEANKLQKSIDISVSEQFQSIIIDVLDNGLGITEEEINKGHIFDLGFSKKIDGTGIGLYVAGDAVKRNRGILKAIYNVKGAHFQIIFQK
jgi:signal transduction histidine kinase